jgi:hypothetical protein
VHRNGPLSSASALSTTTHGAKATNKSFYRDLYRFFGWPPLVAPLRGRSSLLLPRDKVQTPRPRPPPRMGWNSSARIAAVSGGSPGVMRRSWITCPRSRVHSIGRCNTT